MRENRSSLPCSGVCHGVPQFGGVPNLEVPAVQRQQRKVAAAGGSSFPLGLDEDIINIPAFLRNQAD